MPKKQSRATSYLYLLINTLAWGAFLPIVKIGFNESAITPYRYLLYRFVFAGILSIPFIIRGFSVIKKKFKAVIIISLIEILGTSIALSFLYIGLHQTSSLIINLLATTLPIFVTLGGVFFLREREDGHEWLGLAISLIGTLVLIYSSLTADQLTFAGSMLGIGCIVVYNIVTTAYFLLTKRYYQPYPKLFVSGISFYVGAITFAILSLAEVHFQLPEFVSIATKELSSPLILFVIAYAAIVGSIIGLTTYIKGQMGIEASEASLFSYLQPVVYIPLGFVLLNERITVIQVAALGIVIIGVIFAEKRVNLHRSTYPHKKNKTK
ncbi:MAG: DMT family transporter [Candidatus Woesebacteria bacterium]